MYRIAICEDNDSDRQLLHRYFENLSETAPGTYQLTDFSGGSQFLNQTKAYQFHIVIFDIEMPGISGIEAADDLRRRDHSVIIIFTTSHPGYVFSSFSAEPLDYLLKPVKENEFREIILKSLDRIRAENEKKLTVSFGTDIYSIPVNRIMFLESDRRVLKAVTSDDKEYIFYGKMNDIEKTPVLSDFIRCHQSFLVNPEYISRLTPDSIKMIDGRSILVSRSKVKYVRERYMHYVEELECH
jgi:two-component system response regulator LytT